MIGTPIRVGVKQSFFYSGNIGRSLQKINYFHYLRTCFLDESIQKIVNTLLKTEALVQATSIVNYRW